MLEILLIIIIILIAPWLVDVFIELVTLSFVYAVIIFITVVIILIILDLVVLCGNYSELISRIIMGVFVLYMIISFIKDVVDGYNSKD